MDKKKKKAGFCEDSDTKKEMKEKRSGKPHYRIYGVRKEEEFIIMGNGA